MKRLIILFTLCILVFLISSCSSKETGRFYSTVHENDYIKLYEDDTFMVFEGMKGATGKFEIQNEEIILRFELGVTVKSKYKDGKIIDNDGEIYVKREPMKLY